MSLRGIAVDVTPLRTSPQFRLLYVGAIVTAVGSRLTTIAVPFQVYQLTRSTLAVGLIGAAELIPRLAGSVVGGAIADVVDRRRLVIVTQLAGAVCTALLAWNAAGPQSLWMVYVFVSLATVAWGLGQPALRSSVPLLVRRDQITAAAALQAVGTSLAWVAGPLVGGFLLAGVGIAGTYVVDVATFFGCAAVVWAMKPIPPVARHARVGLRSTLDGVRYLLRQKAILGAFASDLNAMVFGAPVALFPAVVAERYGDDPRVLGFLTSAMFVGSFLASVTSGWTGRVHRHGLAIAVSIVAWGLAIVVFGATDPLCVALLMLAVAGAADMVSGVFRQSILQTSTPPEMLGRMEGVGLAVWTTGPALGDLEAGGVAAVTSVDASIVIGGVLCVAGMGLLWLLLPAFRRYDAREVPSPS